MVPMLDFIIGNLSYFISLGLALLILIVAIFSYQETKHNGFLFIGIGEFISVIWLIFNLFVLQGVYLTQNLDSMGLSTVEIRNILGLFGFISIGLNILNTGLLVIALILFSEKIKRSSKMY